MKFLQKFIDTPEYQTFFENDIILPNVSYVEDTNVVYYNPLEVITPNSFSGRITVSDEISNDLEQFVGAPIYAIMSPVGIPEESEYLNVMQAFLNNIAVMKINGVEVEPTFTLGKVDIITMEIIEPAANGTYDIYVEFKQPFDGGILFNLCMYESLDISNLDTSRAYNMEDMFALNSLIGEKGIIGIENLNTSNVTNMSNMFDGCRSLTSLDLTNWDTSNVTYMSYMFDTCQSLTEIRMGGDVSKVTSASSMFREITSTGTFYYNSAYDYSIIVAELPSTWTAVPCTMVNGELVPNN